MKHTRRSRKSITLAQKLLGTGQNEDKLSINAFKMLREKRGCLTLTQLANIYNQIPIKLKKSEQKQALNLLESFISESLLLVNQPTSSASESYLLLLSQIQKLSQTLDQVLTSTDLVLPPWYEKFAETKSLRLLLPTKTDYVDSRLNCWNSCAKSTDVASWFTVMESRVSSTMTSMNLKMTSSPLLTSSLQATMVSEAQPLGKNDDDCKMLMVEAARVVSPTNNPDIMLKSTKLSTSKRERMKMPVSTHTNTPEIISVSKQEKLQSSISPQEQEASKPVPNGVVKVRLYPTPHQRKKLDKMVLANRYAWNLMAELTGDYKLFDMKDEDIAKQYRPFMTKQVMSGDLYVKDCPEECFDSAYRDILKAKHAILAASAAQKARTDKGFKPPEQLNFKTKKQGSVSIEIKGKKLTYDAKNRTIALYPQYFQDKENITPTITRKFGKEAGYDAKTIAKLNAVIKANNIKEKEKINRHHKIRMKTDLAKLGITTFNYSCRLTQYYDDYYLLIPYIRHVEPANSNRVCAIDPGVRTFLTGYDPSGATFEIAKDNKHLYSKKSNIERLRKVLNTVTGAEKTKINKQIQHIYRKIKNCVHDLNHCASKMLAQTYDEVLLPKFSTSEMVKKSDTKKKRRINAVTAYNMQTLSHYKFQQLLKHKMEIRKGKLHICSEEYTSKTCGACGRLNHSLGGKKTFVCPFEDCRITIDRDINGARNIFIKNINLVGCKSYHRPEPPGKPIM